MQAQSAGFRHASLCRNMILLSGAATLCAYSLQTLPAMTWTPASALKPWQVWRFFTHSLIFQSGSEWILSALLLYNLRAVERQLGSVKFASFTIATTSIAVMIQVLINLVFKAPTASGIYGPLFAALVQFYNDVPTLQPLSSPLRFFNEKSFTYFLAFQMSLVSGPHSLRSALCGVIAGILYRVNAFYMRSFQLPAALSRFLLPSASLSSSSSTATAPRAAVPSSPVMSSRTSAAPASSSTTAELREDHIQQLILMGFSRDRAIESLRRSGNDLQRAIHSLLDG